MLSISIRIVKVTYRFRYFFGSLPEKFSFRHQLYFFIFWPKQHTSNIVSLEIGDSKVYIGMFYLLELKTFCNFLFQMHHFVKKVL